MRIASLALVCLAAPLAAAQPSAQELLERYDRAMGPPTFYAEAAMTATRENGSTRTYVMRMLKGEAIGDDMCMTIAPTLAIRGSTRGIGR